MTRVEVFDRVQDVLGDTMRSSGRAAPPLSESSHLLADLGLTSIDFAEITIGLESSLEIREFPITDWLKREAQRSDGAALTVGSLVDACLLLMANGSDALPQVTEGSTAPKRAEPGLPAPPASRAGMPIAWAVFALAFCAAVVGTVLASR